jgi:hypothetical protein
MQMNWIGKDRNENGLLLILCGMLSTYIIGGFLALLWWSSSVTGDESMLFTGRFAVVAFTLGGICSIAGLLLSRRS